MNAVSLSLFNWVDYTIVVIIAVSVLISIFRGFVRESMSLATWILAFWLGFKYTALLADRLVPYIQNDMVRTIVGFLVLFLATLLVGGLIGYLVAQMVNKTGLSGTDRLLGMVFGATRGVLLVTVLIMVSHVVLASDSTPAWQTQSQLWSQFGGLVIGLHKLLPDQVSRVLKSAVSQH